MRMDDSFPTTKQNWQDLLGCIPEGVHLLVQLKIDLYLVYAFYFCVRVCLSLVLGMLIHLGCSACLLLLSNSGSAISCVDACQSPAGCFVASLFCSSRASCIVRPHAAHISCLRVSGMCPLISAVIHVLDAVWRRSALCFTTLSYLCEVVEDVSVLAGVQLKLRGTVVLIFGRCWSVLDFSACKPATATKRTTGGSSRHRRNPKPISLSCSIFR